MPILESSKHDNEIQNCKMKRKQLKFIDRMEKLLSTSPLPCRKINQASKIYYERYGGDKYLQGFTDRYEDTLQRELRGF